MRSYVAVRRSFSYRRCQVGTGLGGSCSGCYAILRPDNDKIPPISPSSPLFFESSSFKLQLLTFSELCKSNKVMGNCQINVFFSQNISSLY